MQGIKPRGPRWSTTSPFPRAVHRPSSPISAPIFLLWLRHRGVELQGDLLDLLDIPLVFVGSFFPLLHLMSMPCPQHAVAAHAPATSLRWRRLPLVHVNESRPTHPFALPGDICIERVAPRRAAVTTPPATRTTSSTFCARKQALHVSRRGSALPR
jgi:hypothetical protein